VNKKIFNGYKIESTRASWWDYQNPASYFLTICTKEKIPFFGSIPVETRFIASAKRSNADQSFSQSTTVDLENTDHAHQKMVQLSATGRLAHDLWLDIPLYFPIVSLGAFVIMPNHIHGILTIRTKSFQHNKPPIKSGGGATGDHNPMLQESIPRIIRWYKGRSSFEIHKTEPSFSWQPRYYDRIIRHGPMYAWIDHYIRENPKRWIEKRTIVSGINDTPGDG
jgi:putative transposase